MTDEHSAAGHASGWAGLRGGVRGRAGPMVTGRRVPVTTLGDAYRSLAGGERVDSPATLIERLINQFAGTVRRRATRLKRFRKAKKLL